MPNISPHSVYFFNISITFFNFNHVFQYKIKTDKSEKLPVRVDEVGLKPRPSLVTPEALSFLKTFLVLKINLRGRNITGVSNFFLSIDLRGKNPGSWRSSVRNVLWDTGIWSERRSNVITNHVWLLPLWPSKLYSAQFCFL